MGLTPLKDHSCFFSVEITVNFLCWNISTPASHTVLHFLKVKFQENIFYLLDIYQCTLLIIMFLHTFHRNPADSHLKYEKITFIYQENRSFAVSAMMMTEKTGRSGVTALYF